MSNGVYACPVKIFESTKWIMGFLKNFSLNSESMDLYYSTCSLYVNLGGLFTF